MLLWKRTIKGCPRGGKKHKLLVPINNPYGYLKSSFTEMTSLMKGNLSLNEIREVKDYMDGICNKISKKTQSNKPKDKIMS